MKGEAPSGYGLNELDARMERRRRAVPPPRPTPARAVAPVEGGAPRPPSSTPKPKRPKAAVENPAAPPQPAVMLPASPNEPLANLTVRVRRSYDDRLANLLHELRHEAKSSKAELVELAIGGLPEHPTPELIERLRQLRTQAPRR